MIKKILLYFTFFIIGSKIFSNTKESTIDFYLKEEKLVDLIKRISKLKNINIILPQGASAIPYQGSNVKPVTITFHPFEKKISIEKAWDYLQLILNISGYVILKTNNIYKIIKKDKNISNREVLPIYMEDGNLSRGSIPNIEEKIRYIYYFSNLNVSKSSREITGILNDMLTKDSLIKADGKSNCIIITDFAKNIKDAMKIIYELDQTGFREAIEVIPIKHTTSSYIASIFNGNQNEGLLPKKDSQSRPLYVGKNQPEEKKGTYFSENIKIVSLDRTNSLVIMGNMTDIQKVKNFIVKYLDKPRPKNSEQEKIIHTYNLNYLDAEEAKNILKNAISNQEATGDRSKGVVTGPKHHFEDVIIESEKTQPENVGGSGNEILLGGNRIIVISKNSDWKKIKKLIKALDTPQTQIAIEALFVDITLNATKSLGTQTRARRNSFGKYQRWQTAHISQPILDDENEIQGKNSPSLLIPHLLLDLQGTAGGANLANAASPGATILTLKDTDGSIWSLLKIFKRYGTVKVIAEPFIITKDNQSATLKSERKEWKNEGSAKALDSGSVDISYQEVSATFQITITPRISEATNNINLTAQLKIEEFKGESTSSRVTRDVQTNANVGNDEVLVLGGLLSEAANEHENKTPIIGQIPILGWIAKNKSKTFDKTILLVFIHPKIIKTRKNIGINQYTQEKLNYAKEEIASDCLNFQNLRDPITRWFFTPKKDSGIDTVNKFLKQEEYNPPSSNHNNMTRKGVKSIKE